MDFYLTEKLSSSSIALSMLPEQIEHKSSASFERYNVISMGPAEVHNGNELQTFAWNGKFPKQGMKGMAFVKEWHWQSPEQLERVIRRWEESGAVLNFMVTGTNINYDVVIKDFDITIKGANFWDYSISLAEFRELKIYTVQEAANRDKAGKKRSMSNMAYAREKQVSYTVKPGDTLWGLARKYLGDGGQYTAIYALNRDVIGQDPSVLQSGTVITIPV